jgi:hypothetical protein
MLRTIRAALLRKVACKIREQLDVDSSKNGSPTFMIAAILRDNGVFVQGTSITTYGFAVSLLLSYVGFTRRYQ